ncbi:MAG: coenzyme F420-0:L-glutamate ligase [Pseudomonadota bacterium]
MMPSVTLTAIPDLPDFKPGDDLAKAVGNALVAAGFAPQDGDILCVAQKVFSKVEGCIVKLATVKPSQSAQDYATQLNKDARKVEVILGQSSRVLRAFKHEDQNEGTMICRHKLGFTSANAGVDESNLDEPGTVMTLPADPDASAQELADALGARFSVQIGVVMTDTFGRPWRLGQVNVAIGLANVPATMRLEGEADGWGRPLTVTEPALADELSAAAGLVMAKSAKTPVVLVRGLRWHRTVSSAVQLVRAEKEDMFT